MAQHKGFTLVELVVVVLILGILAAIAAPKIINNSDEASDSAVSQTLASLRDAVELYRAAYNSLPDDDNSTAGAQVTDSDSLHAMLSEFLRGTRFPICNVGGKSSNSVKLVTGTPTVQTGPDGWVYSTDEGEFIINSSSQMVSSDDANETYDKL